MRPDRLRVGVFFSMAMNVSQFIVPIVSLPYLTRTLGPKSYGEMMTVQAMVGIAAIFVDYGFGFSATAEVAKNSKDKNSVSIIFGKVFNTQLTLFLFAAFLFYIAHVFFVGGGLQTYFAAVLLLFAGSMTMNWFFQGMEITRGLTAVNILLKFITLPLYLLLIKKEDDKIYAILIPAFSGVFSIAYAWFFIKKNKLITPTAYKINEVCAALKDNAGFFVSRSAIMLYTAAVPFVLSLVSGAEALANYTLPDKIRSAAQSMISPISQVIYPRINKITGEKKFGKDKNLRLLVYFMLIGSTLIGIFLWLFSNNIILLASGGKFLQAEGVMMIMAMLPAIISLSNVLGVQIMLPNGKNKEFNVILITASVISSIICYPLCKWFGAYGAAYCVLGCELVVVLMMILYCHKQKLI